MDMTDAESRRPWTYTAVTDPQGNNINTIDIFNKLFPNRKVAFGDDEVTHWSSEGEQWRMFKTRNGHRDLQFYGEVGFSVEQYHSEQLNEWLDSLDLPPALLAHHKKVNRDSLISNRAMDYIFDHFKNKELAFQYIEKHLLPLEKKGIFEEVRNHPSFNKKSVDELAKVFCDYDFLIYQKPSDKFDLAIPQDIIKSMLYSSHTMKPYEARGFFEEFFAKSSILKNFSSAEQIKIREQATYDYLFILSQIFQDVNGKMPSAVKKELKDYRVIIESMLSQLSEFGSRGTEEHQKLEALKLQYQTLLGS